MNKSNELSNVQLNWLRALLEDEICIFLLEDYDFTPEQLNLGIDYLINGLNEVRPELIRCIKNNLDGTTI
jgi:hypothetical protein